MKAKYPSYEELLETFELRAGFRLWRKEYVDEMGRKRGGNFVNNVTNCGNGYCKVRLNGRDILYHAAVLILYEGKDAPSGCVVNHINNNRIDNHPRNLEWVSHRENLQKTRRHNEGQGFPGVHWYKAYGKWQVRSSCDGEKVFLGYYKSQLEAIDAVIQFHEDRRIPVEHLLELRAKFVEEIQAAEKRA